MKKETLEAFVKELKGHLKDGVEFDVSTQSVYSTPGKRRAIVELWLHFRRVYSTPVTLRYQSAWSVDPSGLEIYQHSVDAAKLIAEYLGHLVKN